MRNDEMWVMRDDEIWIMRDDVMICLMADQLRR